MIYPLSEIEITIVENMFSLKKLKAFNEKEEPKIIRMDLIYD